MTYGPSRRRKPTRSASLTVSRPSPRSSRKHQDGFAPNTVNVTWIRADNSAGSGMIGVDVRNSVAKGNSSNGFLAVGTGASPVHFMIDHSTAENNGVNGAVATGLQAFMIVTNSTLMRNGTGLSQQSGATVASTGNNTINFNTTNTSGTITPIVQK